MTRRTWTLLLQTALALTIAASSLHAAGAPKNEPKPATTAVASKQPAINRQQQAGHTPGTPQHLNRLKEGIPTSTFFGEKSGAALTRKTWETGAPVPGRPQMRERTYPHTTGVNSTGGFQKGVRVSVNKKGEIHGYPHGPEAK